MAEDHDALLESLFYPGAGVKIELVIAGNPAGPYITRVEDLEKEYLVLESPLDRGEYVHIEEGWELTLRCEKDDCRQAYVTSVFVIECQPGKIPLLVCCKPKRFERSSLRRYSRYDVDLSCVFASGGITAPGRVADISLGGCLMELDFIPPAAETGSPDAPLFLRAGQEYHAVIDIQDQPDLEFKARAVRVVNNNGGEKVGLGLEICEIAAEKKEVLKNFLFQCQLLY